MAGLRHRIALGGVSALAFVALQAGTAAAQTAASAPQVGVSAAVRGNVRLVAGAGGAREARSGTPVFLNERVNTAADASLQLLLRDETTFTVGANSDVVIDRYVYDPDTKTGKLLATFAKGTMRYVSGVIAKSTADSVEVKVPFGKIGIRGSEVFVTETGGGGYFVGATGATRDANTGDKPTAVNVQSNTGESANISSGFGVAVAPSGDVGEPVRIPADIFSQVSSATNAGGGEEGGEAASGEAAEAEGQVGDAGAEAGADADQFAEMVSEGIEPETEGAEEASDSSTDLDPAAIAELVREYVGDMSDLSSLPTTGYTAYDAPVYTCDGCYGPAVGLPMELLVNTFLDGEFGEEIGSMTHSVNINFGTGVVTLSLADVEIPSWGISGATGTGNLNLPGTGAAITPKVALGPAPAGTNAEAGIVVLSIDDSADVVFSGVTLQNIGTGEQAVSPAFLEPD